MIGEILGNSLSEDQGQRYQIKSLLGKQRGRRTFLAEETERKERVVLKLILFGPDFTWEDLTLFEREAETLKSLDHAAIPKYLDSFEVETGLGKGFVLVQTYIEAKSLQEWVTSGRRFSESDLIELAQSILVILQYLHSRHPAVVHRDIKPSNILLGDRTAHSIGKVYLVDFGSVQVAHHGGTMTVVGTYGYMPPEQFGGRASQKSDLYSLGATLIYLATGQHPADFTDCSLEEATTTQLTVSSPFAKWIRHLVISNEAQRTASAAVAFQDLSSAYLSQSTATDIAFRIESTKQTFTIRLDRDRIKEKLERLSPHTKTMNASVDAAKATLALALGIVSAWTLFIVAISGGTTGIVLWFIACLILITTVGVMSAAGDRADDHHAAAITLKKSSDSSISLTIEVLQIPTGHKSSHKKAVRSPTQFKNVLLQAIHMLPDSSRSQVNFIFLERQKGQPNIRISGNRRELESLLRYINQWDSSVIDLARNPLYPSKITKR